MRKIFWFIFIVVFTGFSITFASAKSGKAPKRQGTALFRAVAVSPNSIKDFQKDAKLQFFIQVLDLLQSAHDVLYNLQSIRGQVVFQEWRYGHLTPKQKLYFVSNSGSYYLQWGLGENYRRRILFRSAKDQQFVWYKDNAGIWRRVYLHELNAGSLHLYRGGELFITNIKEANGHFWFSKILQDIYWIVQSMSFSSNLKDISVKNTKFNGEKIIQVKLVYSKLFDNIFVSGDSLEIWLRKQDYLPVKIMSYQSNYLKAIYNFSHYDINGYVDHNEFHLNRLK